MRRLDKVHRSHSALDRACYNGWHRYSSWVLRRSFEARCPGDEELN